MQAPTAPHHSRLGSPTRCAFGLLMSTPRSSRLVRRALSSSRHRSTETTVSATAPCGTWLAIIGSWRRLCRTWRRRSSAVRRLVLGPHTNLELAERALGSNQESSLSTQASCLLRRRLEVSPAPEHRFAAWPKPPDGRRACHPRAHPRCVLRGGQEGDRRRSGVPFGTGWSVCDRPSAVSYTHLRAHETVLDLVCRLLLEKKK